MRGGEALPRALGPPDTSTLAACCSTLVCRPSQPSIGARAHREKRKRCRQGTGPDPAQASMQASPPSPQASLPTPLALRQSLRARAEELNASSRDASTWRVQSVCLV